MCQRPIQRLYLNGRPFVDCATADFEVGSLRDLILLPKTPPDELSGIEAMHLVRCGDTTVAEAMNTHRKAYDLGNMFMKAWVQYKVQSGKEQAALILEGPLRGMMIGAKDLMGAGRLYPGLAWTLFRVDKLTSIRYV